MVLWVFDGDMVGKWTNEPCNGVDEVVNHFLVLTSSRRYDFTLFRALGTKSSVIV